MTANGILQTRNGLNIAGDAGPITVPPNASVTIASDGTISTIPTGSAPSQIILVGRIKLVNPPGNEMVRGDDGLFRPRDGQPADADGTVTVVSGNLENSNVNPIDAMVNMISLSRQFDMQMKMLQNADDNAKQASILFNISG